MIIEFRSTKESCTILWTPVEFWFQTNSTFKKVVLSKDRDIGRVTYVKVSSDNEGRQIVERLTQVLSEDIVPQYVLIDTSTLKETFNMR